MRKGQVMAKTTKPIDWMKEAEKVAAENKPDPNPTKREVVFWAALQQARFEIERLGEYETFVLHIESHLKDLKWEEPVICKICGLSIEQIWKEAKR